MRQYEILTNTYNARLSALQNVLTIQSVFTSAAILVIFSELNGIDVLTNISNKHILDNASAVLIISIISFIISLFSFISFIFQRNNCNSIRKELLKYEDILNIDRINEKSELRIPLSLSVIIIFISIVLFLAIIIRISFLFVNSTEIYELIANNI